MQLGVALTRRPNDDPSRTDAGVLRCRHGPTMANLVGLLAKKDNPNTIPCRYLPPLRRGDDDPGYGDLKPPTPLRQRRGVPHLSAIGGTQGGEIEIGWRTKLLEVLEDGVTLNLQPGHHPVPSGDVGDGGELASDIPGLFEVHDPAANGIQSGLEDGTLAFAFRHGQFPPALGDGAKYGVVWLHRGEARPDLPHDLRVSLLHLDVGGRRAGPAGSRGAAFVVVAAPVIGVVAVGAHRVGASLAASGPHNEVAGGTPPAGPAAGCAGLRGTLLHDRCPALELNQNPGMLAWGEDPLAKAHRLPVGAEHDSFVVRGPAHKGGVAEQSGHRRRTPPGRHAFARLTSFSAHPSGLGGGRRQNLCLVQRPSDLASGLPIEEVGHDPTDDGRLVGVWSQPAVDDQVPVGMTTGPLALEAAALTPRLDAPREHVRLITRLLGQARDDGPASPL